jgi:hypothetical protein
MGELATVSNGYNCILRAQISEALATKNEYHGPPRYLLPLDTDIRRLDPLSSCFLRGRGDCYLLMPLRAAPTDGEREAPGTPPA